MLAHKFFDESCYRSDFYAYLASLTIPQLNALEAWFLQTLDYALFVSDEDYFAQYTELTEVVTPRLASGLPAARVRLAVSNIKVLPILLFWKFNINNGNSDVQFSQFRPLLLFL